MQHDRLEDYSFHLLFHLTLRSRTSHSARKLYCEGVRSVQASRAYANKKRQAPAIHTTLKTIHTSEARDRARGPLHEGGMTRCYAARCGHCASLDLVSSGNDNYWIGANGCMRTRHLAELFHVGVQVDTAFGRFPIECRYDRTGDAIDGFARRTITLCFPRVQERAPAVSNAARSGGYGLRRARPDVERRSLSTSFSVYDGGDSFYKTRILGYSQSYYYIPA
jgi:hypothetical protein